MRNVAFERLEVPTFTLSVPGPVEAKNEYRPRPRLPAVWPSLLTEEELILYLRIPWVSQAKNFHNAIENLKRYHDLPCIHICNRCLYPRKAIDEWIEAQTEKGK